MQKPSRPDRICSTFPPGRWVLCSIVLFLSASASAGPSVIVTSPAGGRSTAPDRITLADAVAIAGCDPQDNLIQFDSEVFRDTTTTIRLAEPLVFENAKAGHDRIDASTAGGAVVVYLPDSENAGITLSDNARLSLAGIVLTGLSSCAIRVTDTAQLVLESVDLTGGGKTGLAVRDHGKVLANGCRFTGTADANVELSGFAAVTLTQCTLSEARFANIDATGSTELALHDCCVRDGQRFGIFATDGTRIELVRTRVREHGERGIELQNTASIAIEGSTIEANGQYGLILFGQSSVQATASLITDNNAHGVSFRDKSGGRFDRCTLSRNRLSGIACLDGADGGHVRVTRCTFRHNGMRPLCRGPLHIDPLVPTPLRIDGESVSCLTEANARVELFLDKAGEAGRYLETINADENGLFTVNCRDVPAGYVLTATATSDANTSEFNVIAASAVEPVLAALLADTGPFSDRGGPVNLDALLRRWRPGTRLAFDLPRRPSDTVERYARFVTDHIGSWTAGSINAHLQIGTAFEHRSSSVVVPISYASADSDDLAGRGGVAVMRWDDSGLFLPDTEIRLVRADDPADTCPRVLAHEVGHTLGLCHARVGLLSRMQGSTPPGPGFVNDFSPMLTYYDVLALHILHDPAHIGRLTLQHLVDRGVLSETGQVNLAQRNATSAGPIFSPLTPPAPLTGQANRP